MADLRIEDLRRSERTMTIVRAVAVPFAALQVLVYQSRPYPPGAKEAAFGLVVFLALGTIALWLAHQRARSLVMVRRVAFAGLALDLLFVSGLVAVYSFDPSSALWAVLFVLPMEGAISFQLRGALSAWVVITILYTFRELWGSQYYDYPLEWNSITFRMGIGLLIAIASGFMARDLIEQRRQLSTVVDELRRVDSLRGVLVSALAHDVRNPLTAMRGNLDLLIQRGSEIPPEKSAEMLAAVDRQARRIERLASGLLDLARLEQGRLILDKESTDLGAAVRAALDYVRNVSVELHIPEGLAVPIDPARFEQIVINLVTNAQKHGAPPITIEASQQDGSVAIDFVDAGVGVPVALRPKLFQPFRTASGSSTGLGLSIVRAMAQAHGGDVTYIPNEPQGARFRVTLPSP